MGKTNPISNIHCVSRMYYQSTERTNMGIAKSRDEAKWGEREAKDKGQYMKQTQRVYTFCWALEAASCQK